MDIAIVGYGIAGIAAAIHLRRSGHRIAHFERNDPPVACGAGMLLHPAAMRELDKLGVLRTAVECGAPVRRLCAQTVQGQSLMSLDYGEVVDGQFGLGIQRGTLHRLLSNADSGRTRVLGGRNVISVESGTGCLLDDQHVRHGPFDLIVIADGAHSQLRRQVVGPVQNDRRANSAALVGLLDDPQCLATDRLTQYFDSTRHLSVWPVGCAFIGAPFRCAIAINVSLSDAETLRDEARWRRLLIQLCPSLRTLVSGQNPSLRAYTYRDVELTQVCVGRVAIIGDSAHSMSPQLGVGAQLAMEDAATLASVVETHNEVADALRAFVRIRMPQLHRYQLASRWLTPLFQSDSRAMAFFRDRLLANAMNFSSAKRMAQTLFS